MERLGLALSGGGLRATFFHLGVIRYLSEKRILPRVKHMTSVSGGSILAAHLVLNWSRYTDPSKFDEVAGELQAIAKADLRGRILRRLPSHFLLPYFEGKNRRRRRAARNVLFEKYLEDILYGKVTLHKVRGQEGGPPNLDILVTNLSRGKMAFFTDDQFNPEPGKQVGSLATLAKAVSISAAFPGFFPPAEVDNETFGPGTGEFSEVEFLADGGIYDNLGIRRFRHLLDSSQPPIDHVLVCNAGGHFELVSGRESLGLLKTALRSTEIFMKRVEEFECEVFNVDRGERFTHLRISDSVGPGVDSQQCVGQLAANEQETLKRVRTDLDYFPPFLTYALERHGYDVGRSKCSFLVDNTSVTSDVIGWKRKVPLKLRALQESRKLRVGFFSLKDWISSVHIFFIVIGLVTLLVVLDAARKKSEALLSLESPERNSFGLFEMVSETKAMNLLESIEVVQRSWPKDPVIQADVALASYSILKANLEKPERERSYWLFGKALKTLEKLPRKRQQELFLLQLKGHYLLEQGERLRIGNPAAAKARYHDAFEAYERYHAFAFHGLYGSEYNLCNTAVMAGRLDEALLKCQAAHQDAREENVNFWQAKALECRVYARMGKPEAAARSLLESWQIAAHGNVAESKLCRTFLEGEVRSHPEICGFRSQLGDLGSLCDGVKAPGG